MKKTDLAQVQKEVDEKNLLYAIETGNRGDIVKHLRRLPVNVTPEVALKLADYLDPNRKPIKCGPKPKKKRSWAYGAVIVGEYLFLCESLELARLVLNQDKEAFFLIEDSELWDADGNFAPQWKYPHAKRKRETTPKPKRGGIKAWICDRYKIGSRTFDDLLVDYNK
ncbi:MAG: hypothetical protein WAW31_13365 [Smithella sp.]